MELGVELGLTEVHCCECIGRDVEHGCREEDGMLWNGVGGRLGVDLRLFRHLVLWAKQKRIANRCTSTKVVDCFYF